MTTILITGATRGLGLETATQLAAAGNTVLLGARDLDRGRAAAAAIGARAVQLDVASDASVAAAAAEVGARFAAVDVLVNNAGITGSRAPADELTAADLHALYETNVYGPVRLLHAFLPLLRAASAPLVVNVSSGLGSLRVVTDPARMEYGVPSTAYSSSKAALNMLTAQWAKALPDVRFVAIDPGYTATDLNGHQGTQTVAEGAAPIVAVAGGQLPAPSGSSVDVTGVVPW